MQFISVRLDGCLEVFIVRVLEKLVVRHRSLGNYSNIVLCCHTFLVLSEMPDRFLLVFHGLLHVTDRFAHIEDGPEYLTQFRSSIAFSIQAQAPVIVLAGLSPAAMIWGSVSVGSARTSFVSR